jgi:mannose-6-phosphate isomerase-like protein (cupin superfamily)
VQVAQLSIFGSPQTKRPVRPRARAPRGPASDDTPLPQRPGPHTGVVSYQPVDLVAKLGRFTEHWSPKVIARLNDYEIKVVKLRGEFVWHSHADTDELFLVIDGTLTIQMRDGAVTLGVGQLFVVPRGTEHCPIADGEVAALLIEPAGMLNTGDARGDAAAGLTAQYDNSLSDLA